MPGIPRSFATLTLLASCALALAACSERADLNPNAPGSPGTGNSTEVLRPAAPDGPPGGPSGIAGSAPHPGASGADIVPGTTGSGTSDPSGRSQAAQTGIGLDGGLGGSNNNNAMGASPRPSDGTLSSAPTGNRPGAEGTTGGSANTTSGSAFGQR